VHLSVRLVLIMYMKTWVQQQLWIPFKLSNFRASFELLFIQPSIHSFIYSFILCPKLLLLLLLLLQHSCALYYSFPSWVWNSSSVLFRCKVVCKEFESLLCHCRAKAKHLLIIWTPFWLLENRFEFSFQLASLLVHLHSFCACFPSFIFLLFSSLLSLSLSLSSHFCSFWNFNISQAFANWNLLFCPHLLGRKVFYLRPNSFGLFLHQFYW